MLIVSCENRHISLYYQVVPVIIKYVKILKQKLEQFEYMKIGTLCLVMDKVFYGKYKI